MNILLVQESDWLSRNPHQQHHLMERLSIRGHAVRVIDYDIDWKKKKEGKITIPRTEYQNVHKIIPDAHIHVIRPWSLRIPILDYIILMISHRSEIKRQIREFKPDIIVGFGVLNAWIASHYAKQHSISFVYYWIDALDTLIPEKSLQIFGKFLERSTIKRSCKVIAINEKLRDYTISLGAAQENTEVIGAGIDLERFHPGIDGIKIRDAFGIKPDDIVLFFMGWIYHFSGLKEVALELASHRDEYGKIKLLIVGDGDAFDDLVAIRETFDLTNQFILTGKKPYEEIPEYIAAADVCILPAYPDEPIMQDIVPIKLYEYLAMGKPVITTRLPGIMKEFGEGNGVVYVESLEDIIKGAAVITRSIKHSMAPEKCMHFIKPKSWEDVVNKLYIVLVDI
ncbi:glycosyltransferase [Methanospirillum sp.]|uniref:glycosyltransferase n=1 Tax=Methanospirillum sp. TaxID=45200 RepID=UPI0035A082C8